MDNSANNQGSQLFRDHWDRLEEFLHTDPRDAGCDTTMELLDVYAGLTAAGSDPSKRFPSIHAHLLACDRCAADLEGLLAATAGDTSGTELK